MSDNPQSPKLPVPKMTEAEWIEIGRQGAESRQPMETVILTYAELVKGLPEEERTPANRAMAFGWISGMQTHVIGAQTPLQELWYAKAQEAGAVQGLDPATGLLTFLPQDPQSQALLAVELKSMDPMNRIDALEALFSGFIRGVMATMRERQRKGEHVTAFVDELLGPKP